MNLDLDSLPSTCPYDCEGTVTVTGFDQFTCMECLSVFSYATLDEAHRQPQSNG